MANKTLHDQISTVLRAWTAYRPSKSFFGMTLEDFARTVAPSLTTREELAELKRLTCDALTRREVADKISRRALQRIVNAVRGDPDEGEDGELIVAMGYLPRTLRITLCSEGRIAANADRRSKEVVEEKDEEM